MAEFIELILIMAILAIVFGARRSGRLGAAIGRALQCKRRGRRAAPVAPDGRKTASDAD
ncbi:MAG: hypothetical protein IPL40_00830 [Proteobacteria bacterium]|nr:hypothetical protein [Pseudomonadota bacterium]